MSYILIIIYILVGLCVVGKDGGIDDLDKVYSKYDNWRYKFGVFIGTVILLMFYPVIIGYGYIMEILKGE